MNKTENKTILSEEARAARNEYYRKWCKKNPDKIKAIKERYWKKKAQPVTTEENSVLSEKEKAAEQIRKKKITESTRAGKWEYQGAYKYINLYTCNAQYDATGELHRTEITQRCSLCNIVTCLDASYKYEYCPHCGAKMEQYWQDDEAER